MTEPAPLGTYPGTLFHPQAILVYVTLTSLAVSTLHIVTWNLAKEKQRGTDNGQVRSVANPLRLLKNYRE